MAEPSVVLRPWVIDDVSAVLDAVECPEVALQLAVTPGDADAVHEVVVRRAALEGPKAFAYAIELDGRAVGEVGLSSVEPRHRTGWLSYWLAREARGRGLATRALASVVSWAFDELDLARVELGHRVNNPASGAVAVRAGFVHEGVERSRLEYDGIRFDVARLARLATDPRPDLALFAIQPRDPRVA